MADPLTLGTLAMTAASGAVSASSTLAGGDYAKMAGDMQAKQLRQNASQAMASGQRQMFDTQLRTKLALGTNTARASASGVAPDSGSPLTNTGVLAGRGSYQALMDAFNGQSAATGLNNQADAAEWTGNVKKDMAPWQAAGTLAGTAGSLFSRYGALQYPTARGSAGVDVG